MYTVVSITQVIWARVTPEKITLRVVGEEEVIIIREGDELFNFYLGAFKEQKEKMLKASMKLV